MSKIANIARREIAAELGESAAELGARIAAELAVTPFISSAVITLATKPAMQRKLGQLAQRFGVTEAAHWRDMAEVMAQGWGALEYIEHWVPENVSKCLGHIAFGQI